MRIHTHQRIGDFIGVGFAYQPRPGCQQGGHGSCVPFGNRMCAPPFRAAAARNMPGNVVNILGPKSQTRQRPVRCPFDIEQSHKGMCRVFHLVLSIRPVQLGQVAGKDLPTGLEPIKRLG